MRILVYEYVTGGGLVKTALPPALAREGDIMLRALVEDLDEIPGVRVLISRDARLEDIDYPCGVHLVTADAEPTSLLRKLCAEVDAVWPVAPESEGVLEMVTTIAHQSGKILLNSRPEAVVIAASKRETARRLASCGLPVVPVYEPHPALFDQQDTWVIKPDDGVACSGATICRSVADLQRRLEIDQDRLLIAQPHIQGTALSLSLLCRDGRIRLLSCNRQRIAVINDEFHLLGCIANDRDAAGFINEELLEAIGLAIPGLWGYIGIDMMLTADGPLILEINPRLTVSYVGLKRALGANPAQMVLDLLDRKGGFAPGIGTFKTSVRAVNVDLETAFHVS